MNYEIFIFFLILFCVLTFFITFADAKTELIHLKSQRQ